MSDIQKKVINVQSVEDKGKSVVLKDQDGKKFNVWKTKKDGTASKASLTMAQYQVGTGSTVEVSYTEEDFVMDGKNLKTKRVMSFAPTGGSPVTAAQSSRPSGSKDVDWDAIATGKIASNLITALVGAKKSLTISEDDIKEAFMVAEKIMSYSKPSDFASSLAATVAENNAKASLDDDIQVEDVAF